MPRLYLFADESGNFDFSPGRGASRYFILTTVALADTTSGDALLALRRELAWDGVGLDTEFHATTDAQAVRDRVFTAIGAHHFVVHATVVDKRRVPPNLRATDLVLYGHAWALHLARVLPDVASSGDQLLVVGASIGTRRRRAAFRDAIARAVAEHSGVECRVASWEAASDPCLQLADYCSWAVQRWWEGGDPRARTAIADRIAGEYLPYGPDSTAYY